MSDLFALLKVLTLAGAGLLLALMILLALPKSELRSVGMQVVKYAAAVGLFLLVPSPVDVLPDVVPGIGWVDDLGYIVAGIAAIKSARRDGKQRQFEQACENARAARVAGLDPNGRALAAPEEVHDGQS